MRVTILGTLVFICLAVWIYFFSGFKSAFEADKQCHFLLNTEYSQSSDYGCDHDIETRQWLLYDASAVDAPAKVIKRFRY